MPMYVRAKSNKSFVQVIVRIGLWRDNCMKGIVLKLLLRAEVQGIVLIRILIKLR